MSQRCDLSNEEYFRNFCEFRTQMLLAGKKPVVEFVAPEVGTRTPTQNASMHKWFELVADTLNNAGLDMKRVLKPDVDIPWTKTSVKEIMFYFAFPIRE